MIRITLQNGSRIRLPSSQYRTGVTNFNSIHCNTTLTEPIDRCHFHTATCCTYFSSLSKQRLNIKPSISKFSGRREHLSGIEVRGNSTISSIPPLQNFDTFVSCLPGLEQLLQNELLSLGISSTSKPCGVEFQASSVDQILQCHLKLGTASQISLRTGPSFRALGMEELCLKVSRLKFWKQYINMDPHLQSNTLPNLDIRVTSKKSRLYHTKGVEERVERGILNSLGLDGQAIMDKKKLSNQNKKEDSNAKIKACTDSIKILVRIFRNEVEIMVDTSSSPLHKRGYRLEGGKAPLREDLAYALLYSSGYQGGALLDPFCGSGTIAIEGAAISAGYSPGRLRPAPLLGSRFYSDEKWRSALDDMYEIAERRREHEENSMDKYILGSDRDKGAIEAAMGNADRAGLSNLLKFEHRAISAVSWFEDPQSAPSTILVATNPPFGHRVSKNKKDSLLPLYQTLGHKVQRLAETEGKSIHFSILAHNSRLARQTAIKNLNIQFASNHGGMKVFALGAKDISQYKK